MVFSRPFSSPEPTKKPACRSHECPRPGCTSRFTRKSDLNRHDRTHTQLRPYKCTVSNCGKAFNQKGQLDTHGNKHTGAKPHRCGQCSKRFSDPASRSRHKKEAHGNYETNQCPICNSRIKRLPAFKLHLRNQHGVDWSSLNLRLERLAELEGNDSGFFEDSGFVGDEVTEAWQPRQGAVYQAPTFGNSSFDFRQPASSTSGPSRNHSEALHPLDSYLEASDSGPGALAIGSSLAPWHSWQRNPQLLSPSSTLGSMSSFSSMDSSRPASPYSYTSRDSSSSVYSHHGSMVSSTESSPAGFFPYHDFGEPAPEATLQVKQHIESQSIEWHYNYQQSVGVHVPIDPALRSHI